MLVVVSNHMIFESRLFERSFFFRRGDGGRERGTRLRTIFDRLINCSRTHCIIDEFVDGNYIIFSIHADNRIVRAEY